MFTAVQPLPRKPTHESCLALGRLLALFVSVVQVIRVITDGGFEKSDKFNLSGVGEARPVRPRDAPDQTPHRLPELHAAAPDASVFADRVSVHLIDLRQNEL